MLFKTVHDYEPDAETDDGAADVAAGPPAPVRPRPNIHVTRGHFGKSRSPWKWGHRKIFPKEHAKI
jgi:hypothetical protein